MRSLVVEDDTASRMVLERHLQEYGPTDTAANGTAGRR
jgi:CheY-like chemotaxis protein